MEKTFYLKCTGCESLEWDAKNIYNTLIEYGFLNAHTQHDADVIVVMGCTFSSVHEQQFDRNIEVCMKENKEKLTIITGCFLTKKYDNFSNIIYSSKSDIIISIEQFFNIKLKKSNNTYRESIPIVAISEGCYGNCTYCSVKLVRGTHTSRPISDIILEIKELDKEYKSVKLVGQDVAAYGTDSSLTISKLIDKILYSCPNIQIQLNSLNPYFLNKLPDKELKVFSDPRITGNIHIPLQSASDSILKLMRRKYSFELYTNVIERLLALGVNNFSTDIIVGFPGETVSDHKKNIEFVSNNNLKFAQIFMFDPRPGTEAEKYTQLKRNTRLKRTLEVISEYILAYQSRYDDFDNINDILNTNINLSEIDLL